MDHFPNELAATTCTNFKLGYFEPPSNTKRWLVEQRDLQEMYKSFSNGARITLWCERLGSDPNDEAPAQKKPRAPTPRERAEDELHEVFQQLKDKHPGMESNTISLLLFAWVCYVFCTVCDIHCFSQHACV